ncbi:hypothetical protein CUMW_267310, partial [Citrus unshiu]
INLAITQNIINKCRYFLCPLNSAFNSSTHSLSASRNLKVKLLTGLKMAETKVSAALNCIDLSDPDIQKSAASLKQACMDSGFFYVINHGISKEFMDEVFAQSKKFFELPFDEKMKLWVERNRGYKQPLKNQFFDQETNQQAHGEAYSLVGPETEDDLDPEKPLCGPNVWPSADVLPGWKETMLRYQQEALNLGRKIGRIIALALDLDVDFFDKPEILGNAMPYVSFNHYGVQDADPSKEYILGTPAHSDPSLITLLATDEVPGLQICRNIHANPRVWENCFYCQYWRYVGEDEQLCFQVHNAQSPVSPGDHQSPFDIQVTTAMIECFPTCKSEEKPPKYPPIKCKDLFNIIFKNVADGKTARDITEA